MLLIVGILAAAIIAYGEMQRRMSLGLVSRQNELVSLQDQQHTRQVDADKLTAQALAQLSLHVQQSNQITRDMQAILASMHTDMGEWSGDVSRGQARIDNRLTKIDDRLGVVDTRLEAIMDLAGQIYRAVDASNDDARSMLDTMLTELRAMSEQAAPVAQTEDTA